MSVVAVEGSFRCQGLRYQVSDVRAHCGPAIVTIDAEVSSFRHPMQRDRILTRFVIVLSSCRRVLIGEEAEVGRDQKCREGLELYPRVHLAVIVKTRPEVTLVARCTFKLSAKGQLG